jgi:hypothetical protein
VLTGGQLSTSKMNDMLFIFDSNPETFSDDIKSSVDIREKTMYSQPVGKKGRDVDRYIVHR